MSPLFKIIPLCIFLVACGETVKVTTVPIDRVQLNISNPRPVKLKPVKWKVIQNHYALDDRNFSNLNTNLDVLQNRLNRQSEIIKHQKNFYESTN
jgi:ActR/RegA family two-component response regulator